MHIDFPSFRYQGEILNPANLRYAPHPDIIFPSVIRTEHLRDPLGRYYLYYAPHDAPGGLCLAYADAPEGPWIEYPHNPLITHAWPPHYNVSHVSSPHAIWNAEEGRLFLYFHGENDTTRFAVSEDGRQFAYGGVAVTTAMFEEGLTEASYARVFRHTPPGADTRYVMLLMGNHRGTRNVYLACSPDGRVWTARQEPWLVPPPATDQMGPGWLVAWHGHHYIIAFANRTDSPALYDPISDLYLFEVDATLTDVAYRGILMDHTVPGPDNCRISDPCLLEDDTRWYLFLNTGRRRHQRIALAVANIT